MSCGCNKSNRPGRKYSMRSDTSDTEECDFLKSSLARSDYSGCQKYENCSILDDQAWSALTSLQGKACRFTTSETEDIPTDPPTPHFEYSYDFQYGSANVLKRVNDLIDYMPQSEFLKRMKQQCKSLSNNPPNIFSALDEGVPNNSYNYQMSNECTRIDANENQKSYQNSSYDPGCSADEKLLDHLIDKRLPSRQDEKRPKSANKKSEHVSRSRKPVKCRGRRKRKSGSEEKCESDDFEPTLKRPHENSCERCWRYASPSRSPVNKPDQKFDPNFRRGHSCYDFVIGDGEFYDRHISPCKNLQPITSREEQQQSLATSLTVTQMVPEQRPLSSIWQRSPDVQPKQSISDRLKSSGVQPKPLSSVYRQGSPDVQPSPFYSGRQRSPDVQPNQLSSGRRRSPETRPKSVSSGRRRSLEVQFTPMSCGRQPSPDSPTERGVSIWHKPPDVQGTPLSCGRLKSPDVQFTPLPFGEQISPDSPPQRGISLWQRPPDVQATPVCPRQRSPNMQATPVSRSGPKSPYEQSASMSFGEQVPPDSPPEKGISLWQRPPDVQTTPVCHRQRSPNMQVTPVSRVGPKSPYEQSASMSFGEQISPDSPPERGISLWQRPPDVQATPVSCGRPKSPYEQSASLSFGVQISPDSPPQRGISLWQRPTEVQAASVSNGREISPSVQVTPLFFTEQMSPKEQSTPLSCSRQMTPANQSTPKSSHGKSSQVQSTPISSHGQRTPQVQSTPVSSRGKRSPQVQSTPMSSHGQRSQVQSTPMSTHGQRTPQVQSTPVSSHGQRSPQVQSTPMSSHGQRSPQVQFSPMSSHGQRSPQVQATPMSCSRQMTPAKQTTPLSYQGQRSPEVQSTPLPCGRPKSPYEQSASMSFGEQISPDSPPERGISLWQRPPDVQATPVCHRQRSPNMQVTPVSRVGPKSPYEQSASMSFGEQIYPDSPPERGISLWQRPPDVQPEPLSCVRQRSPDVQATPISRGRPNSPYEQSTSMSFGEQISPDSPPERGISLWQRPPDVQATPVCHRQRSPNMQVTPVSRVGPKSPYEQSASMSFGEQISPDSPPEKGISLWQRPPDVQATPVCHRQRSPNMQVTPVSRVGPKSPYEQSASMSFGEQISPDSPPERGISLWQRPPDVQATPVCSRQRPLDVQATPVSRVGPKSPYEQSASMSFGEQISPDSPPERGISLWQRPPDVQATPVCPRQKPLDVQATPVSRGGPKSPYEQSASMSFGEQIYPDSPPERGVSLWQRPPDVQATPVCPRQRPLDVQATPVSRGGPKSPYEESASMSFGEQIYPDSPPQKGITLWQRPPDVYATPSPFARQMSPDGQPVPLSCGRQLSPDSPPQRGISLWQRPPEVQPQTYSPNLEISAGVQPGQVLQHIPQVQFNSKGSAKEMDYGCPSMRSPERNVLEPQPLDHSSQANFPASQGTLYSEPMLRPRPNVAYPGDMYSADIKRCSDGIDDLDITEYKSINLKPREEIYEPAYASLPTRPFGNTSQLSAGESVYSSKHPSPPRPGPVNLGTIPEAMDSDSSRSKTPIKGQKNNTKSVGVKSPKCPARRGSPKTDSKSRNNGSPSPNRRSKSPSKTTGRSSPNKSSKSPNRSGNGSDKKSKPKSSSPKSSVSKSPARKSPSPKSSVSKSPARKSPSPKPPSSKSPSPRPSLKSSPKPGSTNQEDKKSPIKSPQKSPNSTAKKIKSLDDVKNRQASTPERRPKSLDPPRREGSSRKDQSSTLSESPDQYVTLDHPIKACSCSPDMSVTGETGSGSRVVCCHCNWEEEEANGRPPDVSKNKEHPQSSLDLTSYYLPPGNQPHTFKGVDRGTFECPHRKAANLSADQPPDNSSYERECRLLSELQNTPSFQSTFQGMSPIRSSPRKYFMFYMTKCKENQGDDDVEVLVEELTQASPSKTESRTKDIAEKMKKIVECPSDSMALRFQKGVSDQCKIPQSSRVLYF